MGEMILTDAPTRPALRYFGGKWILGKWIISQFPQHKSYVDVFGGAANILLQKDISPVEVYNDIDRGVVTFFQVLRDQPEEPIRAIQLTPWARSEYDLCRNVRLDLAPLEIARRFWARSAMSISCMGGNSGFRIVKSIDAAPNGLESWNYTNVEHLYAAAARLKRVQIENRDYVALLHDYDHPSALLYLDPPYVHSTRVSKKEYTQEWSDRDHTALADIARNAKGYVIVSGYACNLYQELYERFGWQRIDRDSRGNTGSKRVESLWLSPKTWEETHGKHSQLSLFELL